ncbi:hypothetical protein [Frigoriglobus tundricola]|uniref:Uncharacterized protein n=1 Tax=Frigoriglobus tundricola TaxID=2774151 RepID=A0A6M5YU87_9BACT|nr:hypothetical protein [Frigoriglobus tundricola]QJW97459.1 hypothetical protein FTUN_5033 [Frigoriglobus tundricola]
MRRVVLRGVFAFTLTLALVALPVAADDTSPSKSKAPTKEPVAKAPTFPGYIFVTEAVGEVVKANDTTVTLRVTWYTVQQSRTGNNRVNLSSRSRNYHNPFARTTRPAHVVEHHQDYNLDYLPQSLVRTRTLPAKTDETGKRVPHTQKEIDELRAPDGAPAYASSKLDVTPGTYLEVYLIRDKNIPDEKATDADLRIKYAFVLGKDPNPPKDIASPGKGSGTTPPASPKKN